MSTALTASDWTDIPVATPGLLLDLDVLDRNLDEMAAIARSAGVELYPHAKTHRMADAGRRQIERGAHGLCVAKLGEAELAVGMPVEVFIQTGQRTILNYILRPLTDQLNRALRE